MNTRSILSVMSILVGADDFSEGPGTQNTVGRQINALFDEPHGAVGEREIGSARMEASKACGEATVAGSHGRRASVAP